MPVRRFPVRNVAAQPKAVNIVPSPSQFISPGMFLLAVMVGLLAGCLLGMQPSINGQLGRNLQAPLQASLISFASGTAVVLVLLILSGQFPPVFTTSPSRLPWWIWFGGSIGVVLVTTSLIVVPKIGSMPWFAAVITGQTLTAVVLDHFGLLGNPRSAASPLRLLGASLLVAGVLVIVQAKRLEENRPLEPETSPTPPNSSRVESQGE